MIDSPFLVRPGKKFKLADLKTDEKGDFKSKKEAEAASADNIKQLRKLQDLLYAESKQSLLVVLQAMDAGGKDGTIDHIFSGVNPQGCQVTSFKVPSTLERSHDFLWRHHLAAPAKGMIGIFNRSHYEAVLVERVHEIVPKSVWKKRYTHINNFEALLADEGTTILKFYLHISKKEQADRMQARLDDAKKNWKFSPSDLQERKYWNDYQAAFEDALSSCSTETAPWYAIPADHKWFRNWAISDILVKTLQGMNPKYPPPIKDIGKFKVV
ncbi:MAG: polyphosphate kinase 2 family protein [Tepidisphaeraceae bacterium]